MHLLPYQLWKKFVLVLFDSGSKVNTVQPTFAKELGLSIRLTDVETQKIDGITLDIYEMVLAAFLVKNKANRVKFFEEIFLVTNVCPKVVFGIPFVTLSRANINFLGWELWWTTYTIKEAFPTTRCIELISKKEFAATVLDLEYETYVIHVKSINSIVLPSFSPLNIYPSHRP